MKYIAEIELPDNGVISEEYKKYNGLRVTVNCHGYGREVLAKKQKRGEWGEWNEDKGYPCSNCGEYLPYSEEYDYQTNFCPNCGADMKEGERK